MNRHSLSCLIFLALCAAGAAPAAAQDFVVSNLSDSGTGSLRQAILDANAYSASAASTHITFQAGLSGTIHLGSMLPALTQTRGMTIDGAGASIVLDGGSTSISTGDRVFFVGISPDIANASLPATASTNFAISNLTIQNGNARGGNGGNSGGGGAGLGGGVFLNAGSLTLTNVTLSGNRGVGGLGGSGDIAGGGGGMGGHGGAYFTGGGGGFGLGADGGGAPSGSGVYAPGSPGTLVGAASGGRGGAQNSLPGAVGGINGGGGGGAGSPGGGGGGGVGGGNGFGGSTGGQGGDGGFGGGGGGASAFPTSGGDGGFGGGGGGYFGLGGAAGHGGFGGGGGGGGDIPGSGGFGAMSGNGDTHAGGEGLGAGGAVFVRDGSSLTVVGGSMAGNTVARGNPASPHLGQAIFLGGHVSVVVNSGAVTIADTLGGDGGVFGFSTSDADGGLTKTGSGTLILTAANTYSGGTTVNSGTLLANNSAGSATGLPNWLGVGGAVTINNTGTLGGTGGIAGAVLVNTGGTLAPGSGGPGLLTVNQNVTLSAASTFAIELMGTVAGSEYDRLVVNGVVQLGTATLALDVGYSGAGGDRLFILVNDGADPVTGTFAGLPEGATMFVGDQAFGISYQGDVSTEGLSGGNDVVLYVTAVPEASVLALSCLVVTGGTGAWCWRRRQTRARE